jgi:hypothetical protein
MVVEQPFLLPLLGSLPLPPVFLLLPFLAPTPPPIPVRPSPLLREIGGQQ